MQEVTNKWRDLAIFLHIKLAKISEIKSNEDDVVWRGFTVLKFWLQSRNSKQVWFKELAAALGRMENSALKQYVLLKGPNVKLG